MSLWTACDRLALFGPWYHAQAEHKPSFGQGAAAGAGAGGAADGGGGKDKSWKVIASFLEGRNGKRCRERWHNHLDPSISKEPFTAEEDAVLLQARALRSACLSIHVIKSQLGPRPVLKVPLRPEQRASAPRSRCTPPLARTVASHHRIAPDKMQPGVRFC